jgi:hypothetical protein
LYININSSNVFATIVSSIVALDFGTITLINSLGIFTRPRVVIAGA